MGGGTGRAEGPLAPHDAASMPQQRERAPPSPCRADMPLYVVIKVDIGGEVTLGVVRRRRTARRECTLS